jgi:hypothetical protein
MHRTTIVLSDEERRALETRARTEGASVQLVIRRILDKELGLVPALEKTPSFERRIDLRDPALSSYRRQRRR